MFILLFLCVNVIHGYFYLGPWGLGPRPEKNVTIIPPEKTCKDVIDPIEHKWCISMNEFHNRGKNFYSGGILQFVPGRHTMAQISVGSYVNNIFCRDNMMELRKRDWGSPMFILLFLCVNVIHGYFYLGPWGLGPRPEKNVTIIPPEKTCKDVIDPIEHKWCISMNEFHNRGKMSKSRMAGVFASPRETSPLYVCRDIRCLCMQLTGKESGECQYKGQTIKKRIRKEYRMMSDEERTRYHNAVNALKKKGKYDELAREHSEASNLGAHKGPAFLPWHREYLKRFEFLLLQEDPTVSLPYWDSTMDAYLPSPRHSIMFTDELTGYRNGTYHVTGPYSGWTYGYCEEYVKDSAECAKYNPRTPLTRTFPRDTLISDRNIDDVMKTTEVDKVLLYSSTTCGFSLNYDTWMTSLEGFHGYPHMFISGTMADTPQSSYDPIFFSHHAFIDLIWEMWRIGVQGRERAASEYPKDPVCNETSHFAYSPMTPFPLRNIDGISHHYTDFLYEYAPRPTCTKENRNCGSRYLFCSFHHREIERFKLTPKCLSKVRPYGSCFGYTGDDDICFNGVCKVVEDRGTICVPNTDLTSTEFTMSTTTTNPTTTTSKTTTTTTTTTTTSTTTTTTKTLPSTTITTTPTTTSTATSPTTTATTTTTTTTTTTPTTTTQSTTTTETPATTTATTTTSTTTTSTTAMTTTSLMTNDSNCYNEVVCCVIWMENKHCTNPAHIDRMRRDCQRSCGFCTRPDINPNDFVDYSPRCPHLPDVCSTFWGAENCRKTCNISRYNHAFLRTNCWMEPI